MTTPTNRARYFWHRPGDGKWHQYDQRGESMCMKWVLFGCGMPKDARSTKGHGAYCASCVKADRTRRRLARETAVWRSKGGRISR